PGQIDMSAAIVNAFNEREHLMVEAGTGVGKSLAYLIPSILWAWTNDTPVVVSTATRNLQSQLIGSDIPKALKILGHQTLDGRQGSSGFKVALLKGRGNYLCLRAVGEFFSAGYWTMSDDEQELMPAFIDWLRTTEDGDLDSYEGLPRNLLSCPGEECGGRRCSFYSRCFVYKARKRAAEAHLVIVNHALVLAEATSPGSGILPGYGRLVLDEAHNLESIATEYLSHVFSLPELNRILRRLVRHHRAATEKAKEVTLAAGAFIRFLGKLLPAKRNVVRFKATGLYWKDTEILTTLQTAFERPLIELVHYLHDTCDTTEDLNLVQKLSSAAGSLLAFANSAAFVVKGEKESHAYWIERVGKREEGRGIRRKSYIRLVAAPISVADDLHKLLYDPKDSVILCSATLRVGNDFKYMAKRLGCMERFQMLTATSPFDYFRQALVLAPDCLPDPSANPNEYAGALAILMRDLFSVTHGRALVLFTSYEMMNAVAATAHQLLADAGITLLVQGEGLSREAMTARLKSNNQTIDKSNNGVVLFGAQSFWEGVDVAGEALSCVVLARLPFAQVGDPIIEARSEKIDREGGSSFRDYTLPEAVIKFRQGFGRLVRTKSDRGVVVVTDPRIVTKNYGATFRKSIPASVHTVTESEDLLRRVADFFTD
ncbi:MAG: hypothetical protein KBT68_00765, partial [bacterium]|nr:hypothetical protein [Candidatus Colisoma equi]